MAKAAVTPLLLGVVVCLCLCLCLSPACAAPTPVIPSDVKSIVENAKAALTKALKDQKQLTAEDVKLASKLLQGAKDSLASSVSLKGQVSPDVRKWVDDMVSKLQEQVSKAAQYLKVKEDVRVKLEDLNRAQQDMAAILAQLADDPSKSKGDVNVSIEDLKKAQQEMAALEAQLRNAPSKFNR